MKTHVSKQRRDRRITPAPGLRTWLSRAALMVLGVAAVQAGHGVARGDSDPVPPDPEAPPVLPYPPDNPIVASEGTGNIPGSSAVTPSGAYTYRIPIDVPPGRAGMQPSLALGYQSGAGDGPLGVGWSLEGLSEIRRCHKTWATEGTADGIDFDDSDAFCLDGQKLRQVNEGAALNGHEGAEYRTERDTFARIVAHGDTARGPDRFTVEAKGGLVFEYARHVDLPRFRGGLPDQAPEPDPSVGENLVRAAWLLSEVHDRSGNAMVYDYGDPALDLAPDTFGAEVLIRSIRYTAKHVDGEEPTGDHRRVDFEYLDRGSAQRRFRYESGVRWETRSLLRKITLYAPNPVVTEPMGEYRLKLGTSADTGRPRLENVQRCDANNVCLRSKSFSWWERSIAGQPPIGFQEVNAIEPYEWDDSALQLPDPVTVGDFNGDGMDDVMYSVTYASSGDGGTSTEIVLQLAQREADGTFSFRNGLWVNAPGAVFSDTVLKKSRAADINGDGKAEIVAAIDPNIDPSNPEFTLPGYKIFEWNDDETAFLPVGDFLSGSPDRDAIQLTDYDGDGRIDIFREQPDESDGSGASDFGEWLLLRNLGGFVFDEPVSSGVISVQSQYARAMDFDGDGRGDLLPIDKDATNDGIDDTGVIPGATILVGLDDSGAPAAQDRWRLHSFAQMELVDLNGDGLRDAFYPFGEETRVRWNLGNGFGPLLPLTSTISPVADAENAPDAGLRAADLDGDGIEDLVSFANSNDPQDAPKLRLFRMRGEQMVEDVLDDTGTKPLMGQVQEGWPYCTLGDFNGDGLVDIVQTIVNGSGPGGQARYRIRALIQDQLPSDVLLDVRDEDAPEPAETVVYARTSATPDVSCTWPQLCIRRGIQVVSLTGTAPGGELVETRWKDYAYEDPRMDLQGRGFLGFGKVSVYDEQLRSKSTTTFDNTTRVDLPTGGSLYPYAGLPKTVTHLAPIFETPTDGDLPQLEDGVYPGRTTSVTNTYNGETPNDPTALWSISGAGTYVVHPVSSVTMEGETMLAISHSDHAVAVVGPADPYARDVSTSIVYDNYENPTFVWLMNGTLYRWTSTAYENRLDDWLIGLPFHTETAAADLGNPADPRVTEYDFDDLGRLHWVKVDPGGGEDMQRTTVFLRDGAGLPYEIHVQTLPTTRKTFIAYDDLEGMFPRATWNQLGHYHRAVYHPGYGVPVLTEDPNGVKVQSTYDGFGRTRSVAPDGGTAAAVSYASGDCLTSAAQKGMCTSVVFEGGGEQVAYSDEFGRTWETGDLGFDGTMVFERQRYNTLGQPVQSTRPFREFEQGVTTSTFDSLGRPVSVRAPDTTTTSFAYAHGALDMATRTDANGHSTYARTDAAGRIVEVFDAAGATSYTYGPFDQIVQVTDPVGNATTLGYDELGRRTLLVDPDQGTTTFAHDAFDDLRLVRHHESDANSPVDLETEYRRDLLGRLTRRLDTRDGDPSTTETTELGYDTGTYGLGKLAHTLSPDGVETWHDYTDHGQPWTTEWIIDGESYDFRRTYDSTGRLTQIEYPDIGETFKIGLGYNAAGWLNAVFRPTSPPSAALWQVDSRNLDGMLTAATWTGASVSENRTYSPLMGRLYNMTVGGEKPLVDLTYGYDLVGNVTDRTDTVAGRTESFSYDGLDRLKEWDLTKKGVLARKEVYHYDDLGNVSSVEVGGDVTEIHHVDPLRPHRLASIEYPQENGIRTYSPDTRGRMWSDSDGRVIEYTPFDLPRRIAQPPSGEGPPGAEVQFAYDAFGQRVKKTNISGGAVTTTITLGGLYERRERTDLDGTAVAHVFYVHGDEGPVAQVVYDETKNEETTSYIAKDGLGSVSVVFDEHGVEKERLFHEPFGRRTQADGTRLYAFESAAQVSIGFTGQRHDDDLDLIDMHGRVYDPVQKRFLTPDPQVPDAFNSQSYNRYAYVLNNPLGYTDPSGFQEAQPWWTHPLDYVAAGVVWVVNQITSSSPPAQPPPPPAPPSPPVSTSKPSPGPASNDVKGTTPQPPDKPKEEAKPEPDYVPYNPTVQRKGGYVAGLVLAGVPFGAVVATALMERGVLAKGTPEARAGLAEGLAAGGIFWAVVGSTSQSSPTTGALAPAGGGPAPPVVVAPAGAGVLVGAGILSNAGVGAGQMTTSLSTGGGPAPSADALSKAGQAPDPTDKGERLTRAGRSLQKHRAGGRAGASKFPAADGTPENWNKAGQEQLDEILTNPGSTTKALGRGGWQVTAPDGRGARFDADGSFAGFVE